MPSVWASPMRARPSTSTGNGPPGPVPLKAGTGGGPPENHGSPPRPLVRRRGVLCLAGLELAEDRLRVDPQDLRGERLVPLGQPQRLLEGPLVHLRQRRAHLDLEEALRRGAGPRALRAAPPPPRLPATAP